MKRNPPPEPREMAAWLSMSLRGMRVSGSPDRQTQKSEWSAHESRPITGGQVMAVKFLGLENTSRTPICSCVIVNISTLSDKRGHLRTFLLCVHTVNKTRSDRDLLEDHVLETMGFYGSRR